MGPEVSAGERAAGSAARAAEREGTEAAAARACKKNSFAPETPVLLDDGKTKPISKVKIGDKVESADPETGKVKGGRTVTATFLNHDDNLIDVTVTTADGHPSVLHTTTEHPFWDDTAHAWVNAEDLIPGHALETAQNTHAYVADVRLTPGEADRYNLTVDQLHTYYVLAGNTPVLVHNTGPGCGGIADVWHEGTFASPEDSFQYHFNKHGAPVNVTPEQYLQDSKGWAARLAQPGGKTGLNAKRMPFDDGKFGVKYTDPNGGMGGIIGPDGKIVSFWYSDAH